MNHENTTNCAQNVQPWHKQRDGDATDLQPAAMHWLQQELNGPAFAIINVKKQLFCNNV